MKKFQVAFQGLIIALKDKSIRIQFILASITLIIGYFLNLSITQWLFVFVSIALVVVSEILNTCIEKIADFIQPEYNHKIKEIKDLSSAGVLFASMIALVVALIIVLERL